MAPNSLNIYDTMYGVGVASCMRVLVAIKWREKKHGVDMHTATACCIPAAAAAAAVVAVVVAGMMKPCLRHERGEKIGLAH